MGIEQLIQKAKPGMVWTMQVLWKQGVKYASSTIEKAIVDEAIDYSLVLPDPTALGDTLLAVVDKDEEGITTIAISRKMTGDDTGTYEANAIFYPGDMFQDEPLPIVIANVCHVLMFSADNPLKLHWRFLPGTERPTITIEGVEEIKKVSDYTTYAQKMGPLLKRIGDLFESGRGRPDGSVEPDAADFERMKRLAIKLRSQGYKWEKIAEKLDIEDTKTLRNYRKIWGIK